MTYYTNEASLKAEFGDTDAGALLVGTDGTEDPVRLEKAAGQAYAEINTYLRTGGYVVPIEFTPYGEDVPVDGPPALDPQLQAVSDAFTAWYLSGNTDLSKGLYNDRRLFGLKWLEEVRMAELRLDLPLTATSTGAGALVTTARPRVFVQNLRVGHAIFRRNHR